MAEEPIRLNLGAGAKPLEGWMNIDHKSGGEAYPLDGFADGTVDEVRASHLLEHFAQRDLLPVVEEWIRVLKPGGLLRIAVPDMAWIADQLAARKGQPHDEPQTLLLAYAMGGQTNADDFHRSAFTSGQLTLLMEAAGLEEIGPWTSEIQDCAALPVSLNLQGRKRPLIPAGVQSVQKRVSAIMTAPRVGFLSNVFCAMAGFVGNKIPFHKFEGVFWEQGLTRGMEKMIAGGCEWLFTTDYDTLYAPEDVIRMLQIMAVHPEIDALAAAQVKRECNAVMLVRRTADGSLECPVSDFTGEVTKIESAHFGLTLLRADKIASLPKPWFNSEPGPDGGWDEGRIDADISFWRHWLAAGNTLYQANRIRIAHLQIMATWPGENFRPQHQYMNDYLEIGKPEEVRKCERCESNSPVPGAATRKAENSTSSPTSDANSSAGRSPKRPRSRSASPGSRPRPRPRRRAQPSKARPSGPSSP